MKLETLEKQEERAIEAQSDPVALAMIAAPFAAAGMTAARAIGKAVELIQAGMCANNEAWEAECSAHPNLVKDLAGMKELLNRKTDKTVKKIVFETLQTAETDEIWPRALAGEKVFTRKIQSKLLDHQAAKKITAEAARRASYAAKKGKTRRKSLRA